MVYASSTLTISRLQNTTPTGAVLAPDVRQVARDFADWVVCCPFTAHPISNPSIFDGLVLVDEVDCRTLQPNGPQVNNRQL